MQPKLIIAFDRLSEPAFDAKAELIKISLTGNANFPLPWPAYVPQLADITAAQASYHTLYDAAQGGDAVKITARSNARNTLTAQIKKLASYLELVANGDVAKLQTTGYDLRHDIVQSSSVNPLPAPGNFVFERGDASGTMTASADNLTGAGSYELSICVGDPAVEANWQDKGTFLHDSSITTDGYKPGTVYYGRLRGVGSSGPGVWAVSPGVMAV
jgi:hypothetical protein